jgi:filamentous hemagglutinin family protein
MKVTSVCLGLVSGMLASGIFLPVMAQVISDGTTNSIVNVKGNDFTIINGINKGNNLFHSFSNLSLPTDGSATFDLTNTPNITTIFSRVTGGNVSNIDGLIQTLNSNNPVSLFLMNPNGMVFGQNAKLNIGGSFVGTTANSIKFADGVEFSAINTNTNPLLTMSVPIGLQMGQNSGNIQIQGTSHNLLHPENFSGSLTRNPQQNGLGVSPSKTLALIGNGIQLNGGVVIAESGHIEVGSVEKGSINLNQSTGFNWQFDYHPVQSLADIHLTNASLIDASGNPGGSIHLQGKAIQIQDSSVVLIQSQGIQENNGLIKVDADFLEMEGALAKKDESIILSENLATRKGANIDISARQIVGKDGGRIISTTYQNGGSGGDINVNTTESIEFFGFSPFDPARTTGIAALTYTGGGKGGNISIATQNMALRNGGTILTNMFGGSAGGSINITADKISLIGENSRTSGASAIAASSFLGGNAGAIAINTNELLLTASGVISASTSGSGNAGNLTINARKSVEVDGSGSVLARPSRITASGQLLPSVFLKMVGVSGLPTGNAGNLVINSPIVKVSNQGYIAAENVGSGNAGYLQLLADTIFLDQKGQIRTSTTVGQGGNLELTVRDIFLMRNNSLVSAKAEGRGNGGNINISSPIIAGLENSDIIASAIKGKGGNITITTQGIIGLEFRNTITPREDLTNDITVSSQFNVNGNVKINNVGVDPDSGLIKLPENITDPSQQIASGCADTEGSTFLYTGRGGIPQNPSQVIINHRMWSDIRDMSAYRKNNPVTPQIPQPTETLVPATGWRQNAQGKVELIADKPSTQVQQPLTCAAVINNQQHKL